MRPRCLGSLPSPGGFSSVLGGETARAGGAGNPNTHVLALLWVVVVGGKTWESGFSRCSRGPSSVLEGEGEGGWEPRHLGYLPYLVVQLQSPEFQPHKLIGAGDLFDLDLRGDEDGQTEGRRTPKLSIATPSQRQDRTQASGLPALPAPTGQAPLCFQSPHVQAHQTPLPSQPWGRTQVSRLSRPFPELG